VDSFRGEFSNYTIFKITSESKCPDGVLYRLVSV